MANISERDIHHKRRPASWAVWLALPVAAAIVGYAFHYAAVHDNSWHYHLFWIGMLVFFVPASVVLLSSSTTRTERLQITAVWGLFAFMPKFLRDPTGPLWYDELAHWRQTEVVHDQQTLFQKNPLIDVLDSFPGLHVATDAVRELTGASTFTAGTAVVALLHVSALLGVFFIAERLWESPRVGGIAAALYSLAPGFMIFNTQYAYESLGIVLFIWAVVALVAVQTSPRPSWGWVLIGGVVVAACASTHHLSSYAAAVVLLITAVITVVRRDESRRQRIQTTVLADLSIVLVALWLVLAGAAAIDYLFPVVGGGLQETLDLFSKPTGARKLFQGSTLPPYERAAAFLAPIVAAAGVLVGLINLRRRGRVAPALIALTVLGLAYFPALLFFLSRAGNEGARRSVDFSYLGIAVLVAPVVVGLVSRQMPRSRTRALAGGVALAGVGVVLLMGNVASGFNELYRFPGPYVYGSDTRSQTDEMRGAVDWFRATQGTNRRMIVDRYNGMVFASRGRQQTVAPSRAFPAWDLYFSAKAPDPALLGQIGTSGNTYLVIDERMARDLPHIGIYFNGNEPKAQERTRPLDRRALEKFDHLPYARSIYSSDTLRIYRLRITQDDIRAAS